MTLLGTVLSTASPADIAKLITEYGPAIEALVKFIQLERDEKLRAGIMNDITRGLQYATQSGDTSQLETAIKDHCTRNGCQLP